MNYKKYYQEHRTYINHLDTRLNKINDIIIELHPRSVLDVGCGNGFLLKHVAPSLPKTKFYGVDVYTQEKHENISYKKADITMGLPYENSVFDCVILGEVIEHLPDPDFVLSEIHRVLKRNGTLIISTPNLVSWANRIMVFLGIQPFFTETSSKVVLGRYFSVLGQRNSVQGHLKIFTYRSLQEILELEKFRVKAKIGVPFFFPFPISYFDIFMTRFISLTSGLLYVAKKSR